MEFKEVLTKRRSVRKFLPTAPSHEVLLDIVHDANTAPSSRNMHTTRFMIIEDRETLDKIAEMLRYYETALANWREVREQITLMLPKEKQKSYREITKQMHTRLYNDLVDLKEIRF